MRTAAILSARFEWRLNGRICGLRSRTWGSWLWSRCHWLRSRRDRLQRWLYWLRSRRDRWRCWRHWLRSRRDRLRCWRHRLWRWLYWLRSRRDRLRRWFHWLRSWCRRDWLRRRGWGIDASLGWRQTLFVAAGKEDWKELTGVAEDSAPSLGEGVDGFSNGLAVDPFWFCEGAIEPPTELKGLDEETKGFSFALSLLPGGFTDWKGFALA